MRSYLLIICGIALNVLPLLLQASDLTKTSTVGSPPKVEVSSGRTSGAWGFLDGQRKTFDGWFRNIGALTTLFASRAKLPQEPANDRKQLVVDAATKEKKERFRKDVEEADAVKVLRAASNLIFLGGGKQQRNLSATEISANPVLKDKVLTNVSKDTVRVDKSLHKVLMGSLWNARALTDEDVSVETSKDDVLKLMSGTSAPKTIGHDSAAESRVNSNGGEPFDTTKFVLFIYKELERVKFDAEMKSIVDRPLKDLSAYKSAEEAIAEFERGFNELLLKPYSFKNSMSLLKKFFNPPYDTYVKDWKIDADHTLKFHSDSPVVSRSVVSRLNNAFWPALSGLRCRTNVMPKLKEYTEAETKHFVWNTAEYFVKGKGALSNIYNRSFDAELAMKRSEDPTINLPRPFFCKSTVEATMEYSSSYPTVMALLQKDYIMEAMDLLQNLFHMIDTYGFIPKENREYYLDRTALPVMPLIVHSLMRSFTEQSRWLELRLLRTAALPRLLQDYFGFWMNPKANRVVSLQNRGCHSGDIAELMTHSLYMRKAGANCLLNRYHAGAAGPRYEEYFNDMALGRKIRDAMKLKTPEEIQRLYRIIRSESESGYLGSRRWSGVSRQNTMSIPVGNVLMHFYNSQILNMLPIDLNSVMIIYEELLLTMFVEMGTDSNCSNIVGCGLLPTLVEQLVKFNQVRRGLVWHGMKSSDLNLVSYSQSKQIIHPANIVLYRLFDLPNKTTPRTNTKFIAIPPTIYDVRYDLMSTKAYLAPFPLLFYVEPPLESNGNGKNLYKGVRWDISTLQTVLTAILDYTERCSIQSKYSIPENYGYETLNSLTTKCEDRINSLLTVSSVLAVAQLVSNEKMLRPVEPLPIIKY